MSVLLQLAANDAYGELVAIALFGALGGLAQAATSTEPSSSARRSALAGVVAAIGLAALKPPGTAIELVGLPALAGFSARAVLSALESRIDLALARQQADRALALAGDAIELSRRQRPPGSSPVEHDVGKLSARLDEVKGLRSPSSA